MNRFDPEATLPDHNVAMKELMAECMEILMPYPCRVSAETRAHLEDEARRTIDKELPDFAHREYTRQVVDDELVPAVTEIISLLQMGKRGSHEALLTACAMLERALLSKWNDL